MGTMFFPFPLIYLAFFPAGVPTAILALLGLIVAVAWYVVCLGYTLMLTIGPVFTLLTAYSLYFLGGRYPLLGDLLDRSTPPLSFYPVAYPVYQPPPSPAP